MSQTALTVGTEYLERNIVGTGTEDDPWIIGSVENDTDENMFQNFLDAVYTGDAYVKLVKDIDVAQSKTYREGLGSYITINATKIYSDDSKAAIKNLITTTRLFQAVAATEAITNIQFLNCIINNISTYIIYFLGSASMSYCDFSLLLRGTDSSVNRIITGGSITHCSIDIKLVNGSLSGCAFSELTNCQINMNATIRAATSSDSMINSCTKCGITGNFIIDNSTSNYLLNKCSYCYIAGTATTTGASVSILTGTSTNTYVCLDIDENITIGSSALTITSDQLKSKEYLYEIGFLP